MNKIFSSLRILQRSMFKEHEQKRLVQQFYRSTSWTANLGSEDLLLHNKDTGFEMAFGYKYLRENCQSEKSYDHSTKQRLVNPLDVPLDIKAEKAVYHEDRKSVTLKWLQEDHQSEYSIDWLLEMNDPKRCIGSKINKMLDKQIFWNKELFSTYRVNDGPTFKDLMSPQNSSSLVQIFDSLVKYGVAFVHECPPTAEATTAICEKVGYVQPTYYGKTFTMTSNVMDFYDAAFLNTAQKAHVDSTYYRDLFGIQVFHSLAHDGEGGENVLVDGFYCASKLKKECYKSFKFLSETPVLYECLDEYKNSDPELANLLEHYGWGPVLQLHKTGSSGANYKDRVEYIRYKDDNRSSKQEMTPEESREFYAAHSKLAKIIQDPNTEYWIKLKPGTIVFIDNWRVMHGRSSYTGTRSLFSCYLTRDEWIKNARLCKVI